MLHLYSYLIVHVSRELMRAPVVFLVGGQSSGWWCAASTRSRRASGSTARWCARAFLSRLASPRALLRTGSGAAARHWPIHTIDTCYVSARAVLAGAVGARRERRDGARERRAAAGARRRRHRGLQGQRARHAARVQRVRRVRHGPLPAAGAHSAL